MSSTTDRGPADRGQIMPLFAVGLLSLLLVAALVFDVGMSLFQKRSQQDASDAAALAGARWLVDPTCKANPSTATCPDAVDAARKIAQAHGYAPADVTVNIPPTGSTTTFRGPGYIQVTIKGAHESWLAGLAGMTRFNIATMAVAANTKGYSLPYSFLALNPSCSSGGNSAVSGNGTVTVGGVLQVNTTGCSQGALTVSGQGNTPGPAVTAAGGCFVSGTIKLNSGSLNCSPPAVQGAEAIPDPMADLAVDLNSLGTAPAVTKVSGGNGSTANCPGDANAGTQSAPATCKLSYGNATTTLILHPGIYWGGISINFPPANKTLNVYLLPGVYALAGGGFSAGGNGNGVVNVETIVSAADTSFGGGVLMYNTDDPGVCPSNTAGCMGAIKITGSTNAGSGIRLKPYQYDPYRNLLLYQDRDALTQKSISIDGQGAFDVAGTIYAPKGDVTISGQGSGVSAQVIAWTFQVSGNGSLNVTYDANGLYKLYGVGLVQ